MEYNTDLFEAETIERMVGHFERLLEALVASRSRRRERVAHAERGGAAAVAGGVE